MCLYNTNMHPQLIVIVCFLGILLRLDIFSCKRDNLIWRKFRYSGGQFFCPWKFSNFALTKLSIANCSTAEN
jgi:hypothetical protein